MSKEGQKSNSAVEWLDALGVFISGLCLLHCLLLPFSILSLPILMRYYLYHPWAHFVLGAVIFLVAAVAFSYGYYRHGRVRVLVVAFLGLIMWFVGSFSISGSLSFLQNYQANLILMMLGGLFIAVSHLMNSSYLSSSLSASGF
jgi:hypothetical protein